MLRGHSDQPLSPCISRLVMAITGSQALKCLFSSQQVMAPTDSQVLKCHISSQKFTAAPDSQALKCSGKIPGPIFIPGLWGQVPCSKAALTQPLRRVTFCDVYHTMSLHGVDLHCTTFKCLGLELEPEIPQVGCTPLEPPTQPLHLLEKHFMKCSFTLLPFLCSLHRIHSQRGPLQCLWCRSPPL